MRLIIKTGEQFMENRNIYQDRLDHGILLSKLSFFSLTNDFDLFLELQLTDRRLKVRFHAFKSVKITVSSRIPQGSVLGLILFIIIINGIGSNTLLYADDGKLFRYICV